MQMRNALYGVALQSYANLTGCCKPAPQSQVAQTDPQLWCGQRPLTNATTRRLNELMHRTFNEIRGGIQHHFVMLKMHARPQYTRFLNL